MAKEGNLTIWGETGTEGLYLAFNESKYNRPNTDLYRCRNCGDGDLNGNPPGTESNTRPPCGAGEHDYKLHPPEFYSFKGLNIVHPGDHLTIFSPTGAILWSGVCRPGYRAQSIHNPLMLAGVTTKRVYAWWNLKRRAILERR